MASDADNGYTIPDSWANLSELASPPPVENPKEQAIYRHRSLEQTRTQEQYYMRSKRSAEHHHASTDASGNQAVSTTESRKFSCLTYLTHLRDRLLRRWCVLRRHSGVQMDALCYRNTSQGQLGFEWAVRKADDRWTWKSGPESATEPLIGRKGLQNK